MLLRVLSQKNGGHPPKRLRPPPTMKNCLNEFPAARSDYMLSDWVWVKEPDFLVFLVRLFFYARVRRWRRLFLRHPENSILARRLFGRKICAA
jgi:hypothetical protein